MELLYCIIEDRCGGHLPDHSGLDHRDDVVGEPVQIQGRWELQAHNLSVTQTTVTILTSVVDPDYEYRQVNYKYRIN